MRQRSGILPQAQDQIDAHRRPVHEHGRLEEVIDGASIEGKPPHEHGSGIQGKTSKQEEVMDAVVLSESLTPEEN